jgi:O-antigen ligase
MNIAAFISLLVSTFVCAFSLPAARAGMGVSFILLWIAFLRPDPRGTRRPRWAFGASSWLAILFIVWVIPITIFGLHPDVGVPKLMKLIWLLAMPTAATLVRTPFRLSLLLGAFSSGTAITAILTCLVKPVQAVRAVMGGREPDVYTALVNGASMTNAQRLMLGVAVSVAVLAVLGFKHAWGPTRWVQWIGRILRRLKGHRWKVLGQWLARAGGAKAGRVWVALLVLQVLALLLTFKRGSLICAVLAVLGVLVSARIRWRHVLLVVLLIAMVTQAPWVRHRLTRLEDELHSPSGRIAMWTRIGPQLIKEYPWGIGWRSLTYEQMRETAAKCGVRKVEKNRNHLHSNPMEVLVETGWLGFGIYLAWMAVALRDSWMCVRSAADRRQRAWAVGLLAMFVALLANGLVEYNFGDAELVLVYGFVMGAAARGRLGWRTPVM